MPYCLEVRTLQAVAFKILVEALKELLTETCIEFDETGMKIVSTDTTRVVLVHLKLEAKQFEDYRCDGRISIGVNMLNLHKLIKTINNNDTLTLFMDADNKNYLGIRIENPEKNSRTTYKLNLLDLHDSKITVEATEFVTIFTLPSADFQKICRDMHNLAEHMEIRNVGSQFTFACKGEFCAQETVLTDTKSGASARPATDGIVQGVFSIKHLVLFTKCTNLCSTVDLLLKNDYPIVVKYLVASLGEIKLCLAPLTPQNNKHALDQGE
jgi:proliferating cell nuclear antigen